MSDLQRVRADQIDALRALAVAAVVFSHTIDEPYAIGGYLFFEFGAYGVHMFFVISAYLITGQWLATRAIWRSRGDPLTAPLRSFYLKRALRLMPAYYAVLLAAVAIDLGSIRTEALWHALMGTNILFGLWPLYENISPVGHFWSLSMEWQFYLVWPFAVLLLGERRLLWLTAAVLAVSIADEAGWLPVPAAIERMAILKSLDSLAMGALLAIAIDRGWRPERWTAIGWPAAATMLVAPALLMVGRADLADPLRFVSHEAMNVVFAVLVLGASRGFGGAPGRLLGNRALRYLGVISYGIYLYHQLLIELYWRAMEALGRGYPIPFGIGLTVVIFTGATVAASVSWHFFEAPINRFRHRFDYRARNAEPAMTDAAVIEDSPRTELPT